MLSSHNPYNEHQQKNNVNGDILHRKKNKRKVEYIHIHIHLFNIIFIIIL